MAGQGGGEDPIVDINVTPLVDVVLVLLIIFMVTAPAMFAQQIPLDLPAASTGEAGPGSDLGIVVDAAGNLYLNGVATTADGLRTAARAAAKPVRALISADRAARHGMVIAVLDLLRDEGVDQYAINVEPGEPAR